MSRIISYDTATYADVLAFLGAGGNLTPDQRRILGSIRERAQQSQISLDHQGIDWGLSIPDALDTSWPVTRVRTPSTRRAPTGPYSTRSSSPSTTDSR
ncbi:hypothetical protein ACF090_22675 [Streptomyces sp. NPDC014892]|uniref:DUF7691 family protein n=1 Tax=Streptomyces sp. NPDC014892 TaxID=3364930 RepID=UPI003700613A